MTSNLGDPDEPEDAPNESDFNVFEGTLTALLNSVFRLMLSMKYTEHELEIIDLKVGKYIRSHNPLNELIPINNLNDLDEGTCLFLGCDIRVNGDLVSLFGNFYVGEDNTILSLVADETSTDIHEEHVDEDKNLSERAIETFNQHWEKIWDIITFGLTVLMRRK